MPTRSASSFVRLARLSGCSLIALLAASPLTAADLVGRVVDPTGAPIVGASIRLTTGDRQVESGAAGAFRLAGLAPGEAEIAVSAPGYVELVARLDTSPGGRAHELVLPVDSLRAEVTVIGQRLVSSIERAVNVPGSYDAVDRAELDAAHVLTTHEALRKLPGVHTRDEEGLGLRPNIGVRGLNPTRSTKILLLEDGLPLAYAPYGDNSSYYHPPIERFASIELLKGSSQIAYGPQTLGGVINYLTATPPSGFSGSITASAGDRDFFNGRGRVGTTLGSVGLLLDLGHKQGDGARENTGSELGDASLKLVAALSDRQTLTAKAAFYRERSQLTYSGLTQAEYDADPRQNPFANDATDFANLSLSLTHDLVASESLTLSSAIYASDFSRDWWRQSSNSNQRPNDRNDPACGGMANLSTTCGNEGRLRDYRTWGISPRLTFAHDRFGPHSELHAGLRWHEEEQERRQKNGDRPTSRDGILVENNRREARAWSAFVDHRFAWGDVTITPGIRYESVDYERTNRLAHGGAGASGVGSVSEVLPGLGAAWQVAASTTLFGGIHRGFSPPRVEDVISNNGDVIELDSELSWNAELGVRSQPLPGFSATATWFRMDYENQIVPATLAGGVGSTFTNAGETLHQGIEGSLLLEAVPLLRVEHDLTLRASWTWLPTAEFRGTRRSSVAGFGGVSVSGNRLPYAPETLFTAALGYRHPRGASTMLEAVYTGGQFADDLNSRAPSADGQRGAIPSHWIWNAAATFELPWREAALHVAVKNLADETAIVDRSRGAIPTMPRTIQAGIRFDW